MKAPADGYVLLLVTATNAVNAIGTELLLSVDIGGVVLRGIIDRLDLTDDGELIVTDYKSGRAPRAAYENSRLGGVQFYSFLCERIFGQRPKHIQLLHLAWHLIGWHTTLEVYTILYTEFLCLLFQHAFHGAIANEEGLTILW